MGNFGMYSWRTAHRPEVFPMTNRFTVSRTGETRCTMVPFSDQKKKFSRTAPYLGGAVPRRKDSTYAAHH